MTRNGRGEVGQQKTHLEMIGRREGVAKIDGHMTEKIHETGK